MARGGRWEQPSPVDEARGGRERDDARSPAWRCKVLAASPPSVISERTCVVKLTLRRSWPNSAEGSRRGGQRQRARQRARTLSCASRSRAFAFAREPTSRKALRVQQGCYRQREAKRAEEERGTRRKRGGARARCGRVRPTHSSAPASLRSRVTASARSRSVSDERRWRGRERAGTHCSRRAAARPRR